MEAQDSLSMGLGSMVWLLFLWDLIIMQSCWWEFKFEWYRSKLLVDTGNTLIYTGKPESFIMFRKPQSNTSQMDQSRTPAFALKRIVRHQGWLSSCLYWVHITSVLSSFNVALTSAWARTGGATCRCSFQLLQELTSQEESFWPSPQGYVSLLTFKNRLLLFNLLYFVPTHTDFPCGFRG